MSLVDATSLGSRSLISVIKGRGESNRFQPVSMSPLEFPVDPVGSLREGGGTVQKEISALPPPVQSGQLLGRIFYVYISCKISFQRRVLLLEQKQMKTQTIKTLETTGLD